MSTSDISHRVIVSWVVSQAQTSQRGILNQPIGCISVQRKHGFFDIFHIVKFYPHPARGTSSVKF